MDETSTFNVHVVTPDGSVYERATAMAVLTTTYGQLGVLANHVPFLAALAIDEVRVQTAPDQFDEVAVSGGFAEFSNNTLTVVSNAAERKEDIDVNRAEKARSKAMKRIDDAESSHDEAQLKRAKISLQRAINRINISKH